jgi:hypothetical protein
MAEAEVVNATTGPAEQPASESEELLAQSPAAGVEDDLRLEGPEVREVLDASILSILLRQEKESREVPPDPFLALFGFVSLVWDGSGGGSR